MGRLIEAEALKKALEPLTCGKAKNQSYRDGLNDGLHNFFPQIIDAAPTVDAVKVVHGQWERIINPRGELEGFICQCGHQSQSASNFCPNCGARMDMVVRRCTGDPHV